jgi:hypothetical protein
VQDFLREASIDMKDENCPRDRHSEFQVGRGPQDPILGSYLPAVLAVHPGPACRSGAKALGQRRPSEGYPPLTGHSVGVDSIINGWTLPRFRWVRMAITTHLRSSSR